MSQHNPFRVKTSKDCLSMFSLLSIKSDFLPTSSRCVRRVSAVRTRSHEGEL